MIKAVIFDFDGTLSDRQLSIHRAYKAFLSEWFRELDGIELEAIVQDMVADDALGHNPYHYRTAPFMEKYGLGKEFEEKLTDFWFYGSAQYHVLRKETLSILTDLHKKYRLGILTNGHSTYQRNKLEATGVIDYVDDVIVSGDTPYNKPDVEIYQMMADRLGVKIEECLFVGDTFSTDILGAHRAGMPYVLILDDDNEPVDYPLDRISSLNQLPFILEKY